VSSESELARDAAAPNRTGTRIVAALALGCATAVGWTTASYGPGGWHFALNNIAAADHLLAGEGLIQSRGNPFLSWPPLMPALIALLRSAGLRYVEATWWIAIGAAFCSSYFHGRLLLELAGRVWVAAAGIVLVWISPGYFALMCSTLSQPLFIALASAGAWALLRWSSAPGARCAVALGALGATLSMHRYDGLVFVPVAALVMLSSPRERSLARRARTAGLTAALAAAPLMAWLWRNKSVSGSWTGARAPGSLSIAEQCADVAHMAERVLLPMFASSRLATVAAGVVLACLCAHWLVRALARGERALAALAFPLAYGAALVLMASRVEMDRLSDRLALPLVPALIGAALLGLSECELWPRTNPRWRKLGPALAVGAYLALALAVAAPSTLDSAARMRTEGAGGFAAARWVDTELARWLRAHPLEGPLLSNAPEAVLLGADRMPELLAEDDWEAALASGPAGRVLIFSLTRRRDRKLLERVRGGYALTPLAEFDAGAVYRVDGPRD